VSTKRIILLSVTCLTLGILIGIGIKTVAEMMQSDDSGQLPRRSVSIKVDSSQQEELLAQLNDFADKWRYAVRIAPVNPSGDSFLIQMFREDMKIIGTNPFEPGTFKIRFYDTNPTYPAPGLFFDEEIRDLKKFVNEIPGATFTVEK
jgi:hypothetical protein